MSTWALALALVGAVAYAVLCHLLMVHAAGSAWAIAVVMGPVVVAMAAYAWRQRQWLLLAASLAAGAGMLAWGPRGGLGDPSRLFVLQHAGIHVALGVAFAATLRGPLSLIGRLAQMLHPLTPDMVRYTRRVTQLWVGYFFGMAALSVAVHAFASIETWSLVANIGTPVAITALFVGEYLLRYRLHPEFDRVRLTDGLRAYRARAGAPDASSVPGTPAVPREPA